MTSKMMYCSVFLICAVWIHSSSGSAIPMWEYLSRGEKMSHLYSMFAKQVNAYCKTNTAEHSMKPQCKRDLLMYGLGKLQTMTETHLDSMDPYQRGASDIVWDHMMDGHPTNAAKKESTTPAPIMEPTGTFQRNPIFDNDNAQPSPKKPTTHEDYAMGMDMDAMYGQYQSPKERENLYPEPQNHLYQETNINEKYVNPLGLEDGYLSGPMMVMVKPDGTPVNSHLPKDDDQEAMTIGRQKLPTVEQIQQNFGTTHNFLEEKQEIVNGSPVYPGRPAVFRNGRYQAVQKRSYFYHPSYLPQMYRSNQH